MMKYFLISILSVLFISCNLKTKTIPGPDDKIFYWENGRNERVKVRFTNLSLLYGSLSESENKSMIDKIMMFNEMFIKNELSYIPKELEIWDVRDETGVKIVELNLSIDNPELLEKWFFVNDKTYPYIYAKSKSYAKNSYGVESIITQHFIIKWVSDNSQGVSGFGDMKIVPLLMLK